MSYPCQQQHLMLRSQLLMEFVQLHIYLSWRSWKTADNETTVKNRSTCFRSGAAWDDQHAGVGLFRTMYLSAKR